jgi:hypothetical protein
MTGEPSEPATRAIRIELPIASEEELRALRGALLAARATELSELQRRAARHSFGYGSDTARESMSAEARHHRLRHEMLGRLLAALDAATTADDRRSAMDDEARET